MSSLVSGARIAFAIGALTLFGCAEPVDEDNGSASGAQSATEGSDETVDGESLSIGLDYTCGVKKEGSIACWHNDNASGVDKTFAPNLKGTFRSVGVARNKTLCGLTSDGSVVCTDRNGSEYAQNMPTWVKDKFRAISVVNGAGSFRACGIKATDDSVECWGDIAWTGIQWPKKEQFRSISAGAYHFCGVRADESVYCWGPNDHGESNPPPGAFRSVAAGNGATCGVKKDDTVVCWGGDSAGNTKPPPGAFRSVSPGASHSCGVKADGSVVCWGSNQYGESKPPSGKFRSVRAGELRSCGVKSDGTAVCWGSDGPKPPRGSFQ